MKLINFPCEGYVVRKWQDGYVVDCEIPVIITSVFVLPDNSVMSSTVIVIHEDGKIESLPLDWVRVKMT